MVKKYYLKNRIISIVLAFSMLVSYSFFDSKMNTVIAADSTPAVEISDTSAIINSGSATLTTGTASDNATLNYYENGELKSVIVEAVSVYQPATLTIEENASTGVSLDVTGLCYIYGTCDSWIVNNGTIYIYGTYSGRLDNDGDIIVGSDGNLVYYGDDENYGKITNGGTVSYSGSLDMSLFHWSDSSSFVNYGTISAPSVVLPDDIGFSDTGSSKIVVTDSFEMGSLGPYGTVVAQPGTKITTSGGVLFHLQLGDAETSVTGPVNNVDAISLFDDPEIELEEFDEEVYYGAEYDFSNKISTASGYHGTPYLIYIDSEGTQSSEKPTAVGNYRVFAYAPAHYSYREDKSMQNGEFDIIYLPFSEVDKASGNKYVTLSGVSNGKYVADTVTLTPASTYKMKVGIGGFDFADSVSLSRADLYTDNGANFNVDTWVSFKRKSDLAETAGNETIAAIMPELMDLVFDEDDPELSGIVMVDGVESSIEDGDVVEAKKVVFSVDDDNLEKAVIYDAAKDELIDTVDFTGSTTGEVTIEGEWGEVKDINLIVYDLAGRTTSSEFTLKYPLVSTLATVSVDDLFVGDNYTPVVETESNGTPRFEYKESAADDDTFSPDKPVKAGKYTVRATVPETLKYSEIVCRDTFDINKRTAASSVKISDINVGEAVAPVLTTDSNGKKDAVFEYKATQAPNDAYEKTAPTLAGEYMLRVTIPETEMYEASSCIASFKIIDPDKESEKEESEETEEGEGGNGEETSGEGGTGEDANGENTADGGSAAGSEGEAPAAPGEKLEATLTVDLPDQYYGVNYAPTASTNSNGAEDITFTFKKDDATSEFEDVKPVEPGDYVIKAIVPETDKYLSATAEKKFTISYLEAPSDAYTIVGTMGLNDYYVSDVKIVAKEGYTVANRLNGTYSEAIDYVDGMGSVYLKRMSDGAKTYAILMKEEIKVDKVKPALSTFGKDQDGKVVDLTKSFYADKVTFTIFDEHLDKVYLDEDEISVVDGSATITIDADGGKKGCTVSAYDDAGNEYILHVSMMASWMFTNIVPVGSIELESGNAYTFSSGRWKVDSDSTLYYGGNSFYVRKSGRRTVTSVD